MNQQLPEQSPERLVLIHGDLLVPEKDHLVLQEGLLHLLELLLLQRAGKIHALNFSADSGGERCDLNGRVAHGPPLPVGVRVAAPCRGRVSPNITAILRKMNGRPIWR